MAPYCSPGGRNFDFHVPLRPSDRRGSGVSAYPQSLEIRPAIWHSGGAEAVLTVKSLQKLPTGLMFALGPDVQVGHLTTAITKTLAGNHLRRGPDHLHA